MGTLVDKMGMVIRVMGKAKRGVELALDDGEHRVKGDFRKHGPITLHGLYCSCTMAAHKRPTYLIKLTRSLHNLLIVNALMAL